MNDKKLTNTIEALTNGYYASGVSEEAAYNGCINFYYVMCRLKGTMLSMRDAVKQIEIQVEQGINLAEMFASLLSDCVSSIQSSEKIPRGLQESVNVILSIFHKLSNGDIFAASVAEHASLPGIDFEELNSVYQTIVQCTDRYRSEVNSAYNLPLRSSISMYLPVSDARELLHAFEDALPAYVRAYKMRAGIGNMQNEDISILKRAADIWKHISRIINQVVNGTVPISAVRGCSALYESLRRMLRDSSDSADGIPAQPLDVVNVFNRKIGRARSGEYDSYLDDVCFEAVLACVS